MKKRLIVFLNGLGHETEDCGAFNFDVDDDYPGIIANAAKKVSEDVAAGRDSVAIIAGGSGQGEAIVANRFTGVRAVVYYGPAQRPQTDSSGHVLDMLASTRMHNNANVLSLGGRFLNDEEIQSAVRSWLSTSFSGEERHARRIKQIDEVS